MKYTYKYKENEEEWFLEGLLKEQGYKKTADCYWCQIFERGEIVITLTRDMD